MPLPNEIRWQLLQLLESRPDLSQRKLAREVGVSLGKVNYCLKALTEKGLIKMSNFSESPRKHRYLYKLTPKGMAEKVKLTHRFLQKKIEEHKRLTAEIEQLRMQVSRPVETGLPAFLESQND